MTTLAVRDLLASHVAVATLAHPGAICGCGHPLGDDTDPAALTARHLDHLAAVIEAVRAGIAAEALREAAEELAAVDRMAGTAYRDMTTAEALSFRIHPLGAEMAGYPTSSTVRAVTAHWLRDRADALTTPSPSTSTDRGGSDA